MVQVIEISLCLPREGPEIHKTGFNLFVVMEPDSTTYDINAKSLSNESYLPFPTCPGNFELYQELIHNNGERNLESQIVERLQKFGLLLSSIECPTNNPDCKFVCKGARVIDKLQWVCVGCQKKQPIRIQSFFFRVPCSLLQALQIILAWSEDADCLVAAEHFGVKPKTANLIYERLDELAVKEYDKLKLGGENSVVLTELYPDCLNRQSPDTTDQSHVHRILMMADTNHIPTLFKFHVLRDGTKKTLSDSCSDSEILKAEIEEAISISVHPNSNTVVGSTLPAVSGTTSMQHLLQYCDADMQHFLSSRVWREAVSVCGAAGEESGARLGRYLAAAPPRLAHRRHYYRHTLRLLAAQLAADIS